MRRTKGLRHVYQSFIFVLGALFIGIGIGLVVLPGPLTLPPVLIGLWIWSTEFAWADRFFDSFKAKGREAWTNAKKRPAVCSLATGAGLLGAGAAVWATKHFDLVAKLKDIASL